MKSYISVSLALFLGLIKSMDIETIAQDRVFLQTQDQIEQAQKAKSLLDTYDAKSEELAKLNCLLYDDLTFFDLRELAKFNPLSAGGLYFTFCGRTKDE